MRKFSQKTSFLLIIFNLFSCFIFAQTWTGATTAWSTASNWTPATVPTATSAVVIDACTTCPLLPSGTTNIGTLTLNGRINTDASSGILQLNTDKGINSIAATGVLGTVTVSGSITTLNSITAQIETKSGAIVNMDISAFRTGGASRFDGTAFNKSITAIDFAGYTAGGQGLRMVNNTFAGTVNLTNNITNSTGGPYMGFSGNIFNGDAIFTMNGTAAGFSIGDGNPFFNIGVTRELFNKNLTLISTAATNQTFNIFGGTITSAIAVAGNLQVNLNGGFGQLEIKNISVAGTSTFNATNITSGNGIQIAQNTGNNTFFGNDVNIMNSGSTIGSIFRCASLGNVTFSGNVSVASSGGNSGNFFIGDDANSAGIVNLAANKAITTGSFSRGVLNIQKIRQASGTNAQTHILTLGNNISNGGGSTIDCKIVLQNNVFQGNFSVSGLITRLTRNTFGSGASNTISLTIPATSTGSDANLYGGNNVFKSPTTITNSSINNISLGFTAGWLNNGGPDVFERDVTFNANENTTAIPPPYLTLSTLNSTSYPTISNAVAGTTPYPNLTAKRNDVKNAIATMNTNANNSKINADATKTNADLMATFNTICMGTIPANAGTNQTTANSNKTAADNLRTTNTDIAIDGYTDTDLTTLINNINTVNTQTASINNNINLHNSTLKTCNDADIDSKMKSGSIYMSSGNNVPGNQYLGNVTINTSNRGRFYMGWDPSSPTTIVGNVTINNTSYGGYDGSVNFARQSDVIFGGNVTINSNLAAIVPSGSAARADITFGNTGSCNFNGNIVFQKTGPYFSSYSFGSTNATNQGTQTLAVGKTITIGAGGFDNGNINFNGFKQLGTATPHTFAIEAQTRIRIYRNTVFNSDITFNNKSQRTDWPTNGLDIAPELDDIDVVFIGNVTLRNQAGSTTSMDVSRRNGKTIFNRNITIESVVDRSISFFGDGSWGSTTTPRGETTLLGNIIVTPVGFTSGGIYLGNFKQLSVTPQNISTIATNCNGGLLTNLFICDGSLWNGNLTVAVPNLTMANSRYKGTLEVINCNQSGWPSSGTSGGNVFEKVVIFTYRGANDWVFGGLTGDTYMDGVTFNNENNGSISVAQGPNNVFQKTVAFNNNISFNNNPTFFPAGIGTEPRRGAMRIANSVGNVATFQDIVSMNNQASGAFPGTNDRYGEAIQIAENGAITFQKDITFNSYAATAATTIAGSSGTGDVRFTNWNPSSHFGTITLTGGAKILINTWQAGHMKIRRLTQLGNATPQNITLPLASNGTLSLGDGCVWNSDFYGAAAQVNLSGATYNGTATLEMLGNQSTSNNATLPFNGSLGNNTYNNTTVIRHKGTGQNWNLNVVSGDDVNNNITYDLVNTNNNIRLLKGTTTFAGNVNVISARNEDFEFGDNLGGTGIFRFDGTGTQNITGTFSHASAANKILNFRSVEMRQASPTSKIMLQRNTAMRNIDFGTGKIDFGTTNLSLGNVNNHVGATFINTSGNFTNDNANSYIIATGAGTVRRRVENNNTDVYFPVGNDALRLPISLKQGGTTDVFNINTLNNVFPTYSTANVPSGAQFTGGFVDGVWRVKEEVAGNTSNLLPTLYWNAGAGLVPFSRAISLPLRYNSNTNKWRCLDNPAAASGTSPTFVRSVPSGSALSSLELPTSTTGMLLTVYGLVVNAGSDQVHCIPTLALTLNATALPTGFTGTWSMTSNTTGAATPIFSNLNDPAATLTSLVANTTYTFRWTITNNNFEGTCGTASFDEVDIKVLNAGGSAPTVSVWTGASASNSNDWFDCQNWNTGVVPTATIDAQIPTVMTNYPDLPVSATAVCKNLSLTTAAATFTIQNWASLDVKGNTTIAGTINNAGTLICNGNVTNTLSLINTGTVRIGANFTNNGNNINYTSGTVEFLGNNSFISGTGQINLFNATVNKNASQSITLNSILVINGMLNFNNGRINTTATNLLIINDNATTTQGSATSHVNGPMRKIGNDDFIFPVGKGGRWARLGLTAFANTNVNDHFSVEYFSTPFGNKFSVVPSPFLAHGSGMEYWQLDRGNTGGGSGTTEAKVSLYWESAAFSDINQFSNDLRVVRHNGTAWEDKGSVLAGNVTAGSVTTDFIQSAFSPWTFGSTSLGPINPLPITLLDFLAKRKNDLYVLLDWQTTLERNNKGFEVQKSDDAVSFSKIDFVPSVGNSTKLQNYQLEVRNSSNSYYRLKQIDFDGKNTFSKIQFVAGSEITEFSIYPNPTNGEIHVVLPAGYNDSIGYDLTDNTGKTIKIGNVQSVSIAESINQELRNLPAGMYILKVMIAQNVYMRKLVRL